jgi:hypothetical protein
MQHDAKGGRTIETSQFTVSHTDVENGLCVCEVYKVPVSRISVCLN